MRNTNEFPLQQYIEECRFLYDAWTKGWLDEYSDSHFLVRAIEGSLTSFVGQTGLINNTGKYNCVGNSCRDFNSATFNLNFCINFSQKMQRLLELFSEKNICEFITNQMSAGKQNYNEDTFFEALSEVSILSFYALRNNWDSVDYEPPIGTGGSQKILRRGLLGEFCVSALAQKTKKRNIL